MTRNRLEVTISIILTSTIRIMGSIIIILTIIIIILIIIITTVIIIIITTTITQHYESWSRT
jgi:hypothetical protein